MRCIELGGTDPGPGSETWIATKMWHRCDVDVTMSRSLGGVFVSHRARNMMTLYLGQVARLLQTMSHFLLLTQHLLDVTLYFVNEWWNKQKTKEIYKGDSKADNDQTKNNPISSDAVVAVFIQWDNKSENRECSVALHKRFTLRSPLYISLQKTF